MNTINKHGWKWAYRKIRGLYCTRLTAIYRATLYSIRGNTGKFSSEDNWQKIRIRRHR